MSEGAKPVNNECTGKDSCRSDNEIDGYHKVCYDQCGVDWRRYPGINPHPNKQ